MKIVVSRAVVALAVLAARATTLWAQASPPVVLAPAWTSDTPGGNPLYVGADLAIVAQVSDLRAFDLGTGKLLWSQRFDLKPAEAGACREFVAVRTGSDVRCYDARSGALGLCVAGATGMTVVGSRLICAHAGSIRQYSPLTPKAVPKSIASMVPFQRSTDPARGAHLGRRVVWRADEATLAAFDLETFAIAWRSDWEAFRYTAVPDAAVIGADRDAKPANVTAWDEAHGYYASGDQVAIHASRLVEIPKSSGAPRRAEYVWFVDAKKGGGPRVVLERAATDALDPPALGWVAGAAKPCFVARWASARVAGEHRFDLYAGGATRSAATAYLPYDSLTVGAKGQVVLTRGANLDEFRVYSVPKVAPLWTGRGQPVPRGADDAAPYLALRYEAATNTTHLDQLEPTAGATVATVALGWNRWEVVGGEVAQRHLLFRGKDGELVRAQTAPLAITHRFQLAGLSEKVYAIDATSILVRPGDKLARLDLVPRAPTGK